MTDPSTSPVFDAAFSVDVEDYFQVTAFEEHVSRDHWDRFESRVEASTHRVLRLLDRHGVRGTFFVLGWTAERHPQLVREIQTAGHEIGSHSYWHRCIYHQTPDEFRHDLRRSRDVLSDITGEKVRCFRAPTFSITNRSRWALQILVEEGFTVDSSIFPVVHDRYGIPHAQRMVHRLETPAGPLWEFPPTVARIGRYNLPVAGGGYFRLYPFPFTKRCLARVSRTTNQPFMFYTHPWELDPSQPRLRAGNTLSRFRHYVNLAGTEKKLHQLLTSFRFGRVADIVRC